MDPFDAVMGRLDPLGLMERYVEYLTRTCEDDLHDQFGVEFVREPRKDLPLKVDWTLTPGCLDETRERLDYTPLADKAAGDGSDGE